MTTENPLGPQFHFSWNKQDGKKFQTKAELLQQKVTHLAQELQNKYFTAAQESTRKVAAELRAILTTVEEACLSHDQDQVRKTSTAALLEQQQQKIKQKRNKKKQ